MRSVLKKAIAAVPPPQHPHVPDPSEAEAVGSDSTAVVAAWYKLPPCRDCPQLHSLTSVDKWLNWARPMGSASPSAVGQRHRYPAKRPTWLHFQKVLSAHMASGGGSPVEDTRLLMALYSLVQASQRAYFNRDTDSE